VSSSNPQCTQVKQKEEEKKKTSQKEKLKCGSGARRV